VFALQKSSKFKVSKAFFIVQEPRNYGVSNEVNIAKVINFVLGQSRFSYYENLLAFLFLHSNFVM